MVSFIGREINAIGGLYPIEVNIEAKNYNCVINKIYENYEHIHNLEIEEVK
jgi:hypothetical protein